MSDKKRQISSTDSFYKNKQLQTAISNIENNIGYNFINPKLLITSITHSTYSYENKLECSENNERLEFLGDGVLDLIIADILYRDINEFAEGIMSKIKSLVVCETTLAEIASTINLGEYLLLGKGEEVTNGRQKPSNLSNAMEALIAAIYLDGGYDVAYEIVKRIFKSYIEKAKKGKIIYDYKSKFLEYVQGIRKKEKIDIIIVKEEGPEHNRKFFAQVNFEDTIIGAGCGSTKKEAEQEATKEALKKIKSIFPNY